MINHPRAILKGVERDRAVAASQMRRSVGSEFIAKPASLEAPSAESAAMEAELRAMVDLPALIGASGKLQLLDRLLGRHIAQGSRALVFSQYTLTLDVLQEYCALRFGPEGTGFLRLDGATNRIKREMDVRSFNAPGSGIPVYLISTKAGGMV